MLCTKKYLLLQRHAGDSWFPGYSWKICTCPHCGHHLGWTFENVTPVRGSANIDVNKFHGLILSNILEENCEFSLQSINFNSLFDK